MSDAPAPASSPRVFSIDALRGFDMFWIIGGDALAQEILKLGGWSFSPALSDQFEHVEWEGFRFYDLIFPLFLFLVGCVLPYSLEKYRERPSAAYWRVARRTALLILLGLLANSLLQFDCPAIHQLPRNSSIFPGRNCVALRTIWAADLLGRNLARQMAVLSSPLSAETFPARLTAK